MKVYISGAISNRPFKKAKEHFEKVETELKRFGHEVVNPISFAKEKEKKEWIDYMIEDIAMLKDCKGICMLKGWRQSEGAVIEFLIALKLNIEIIQEGEEWML